MNSPEDAIRIFLVKTGKALQSGDDVTISADQAKVIRARLIAFGHLKGSMMAALDEADTQERNALK